ncbi:MAG: hypothetical protein ACKOGA_21195 [Planctomycetaceae bacterium]
MEGPDSASPSLPLERPAPLPGRWRFPGSVPRTLPQWAGLWVGIGVLLRLVRYALPFPLWCDEYQLADNFIDRDLPGLFRPLVNNQVAPLGFLLIEKLNTLWLGFHPWALRLFPCVCAIASLFVMRQIARRLFTGTAQVLAVAILAVSYYPIRLGSEVKPYAGDLLAALLLLQGVLEWRADGGRDRWLWRLTLLLAPLLLCSFPAVFVGGATSLAIASCLWHDWRTGRWPAAQADAANLPAGLASRNGAAPGSLSARAEAAEPATPGMPAAEPVGRLSPAVGRPVLAWFCFNAVLVTVFGAVVWLNASQQYQATAREMLDCWFTAFPPWRDPGALALWLLDAHTGVLAAYPVGAENGGSTLTALGCLLGVWVLWRQRQHWLLVWCAAGFGLTLLAASLHRYPYGGHARLGQHLAPAVMLALAAGVGRLIEARPTGLARQQAWQLAVAGCLLLAVGTPVRDLVQPSKSADDYAHQGFARWFWGNPENPLTVCVRHDLGESLYGPSLWTPFRVYRQIFQKSRLPAAEVRARVAAAAEPVRCVVFHSSSAPRDDEAFARWYDGMLERYRLAGRQRLQVPLKHTFTDRADFMRLCYDVYDFVPREGDEPPAQVGLAGHVEEASDVPLE